MSSFERAFARSSTVSIWSAISWPSVGRQLIVTDPVAADDAERAARLWRRGSGLSLADRLCLALADRVDEPVLTADQVWGTDGRVQQIR